MSNRFNLKPTFLLAFYYSIEFKKLKILNAKKSQKFFSE